MDVDILMRYLPLLIPIALIEVALMIAALLDLRKQPATRGPKWVWVLVIVLVNFIGPLLYFVLAREEE